MKKYIILLPRNRVRRNYQGGAGIDKLHNEAICVDNDQPEEWLGSLVEASNPGLPEVPHEGLISIDTPTGPQFLRDILDAEKEFYLGDYLHADGSWQLSYLFKILDSSMRLHVQAHPTTEFANKILHKPYGKLECYYILGVRPGQEPYIRLGFQHAPTKQEWKLIVETQDKVAMDACFAKVPVEVGQVWYIPGGMPHAIGENITLLEIMEPSDLVVRCEFEREGIVVPPPARFMDKGLDFCLDIFDYQEYSVAEITRRCQLQPQVVEQTNDFTRTVLVDTKLTPCFKVEKLELTKNHAVAHAPAFTLGVVVKGDCVLTNGTETVSLKRGDSFALAAALQEYTIEPLTDSVEIVEVLPGPDMKVKHV